MKLESFGLTDRGIRRHHNEDAYMVRNDLGFFVVADGMGGHAAGEVAADLAVREAVRLVDAYRFAPGDAWPEEAAGSDAPLAGLLVHAIVSAHRRVTEAVDDARELRGMGATIVAALADPANGTVFLAHVGDSRAYVLSDSGLELATADHSWVHEQVEAGLLSAEAARNHPLKNVVTRALGGAQEPIVDIQARALRPDQVLLLCSDGLNSMLEDDEIGAVLSGGGSLDTMARELVGLANQRGGTDNITVVLIRVLA